ncbi:uncharacterized protein LOC134965227 [Pseudophryne corroboree]|uniref:uncharacterized protein LOC134965227 n=1 Tax=Pseudophryne corroboree TaxID=495146 RepID=UPI00308159C4
MKDHRLQVQEVLKRLRQHHLYCKLEKCVFEQPSMPFLGYIISGSGLEMDPAKVQAILKWPKPNTLKSIQRFLGFANFYQRFIKGFSAIVAPITALTQKEANPREWSPAAEAAFLHLKQAFTTAPVLRQPNTNKAFVLEVDASADAVGAVLSQRSEDNKLHPCGFFSKKFLPEERNYTIGE